ncbi:MAG: YifB family Mg chelatase-like AAA ATPase [Planctomycetota bacterium]|nr:YifB family Mg chelatase-like AAA ATPase [Planctomycetota bacterium]
MLARVPSYLLSGIDALPCEVEVHHDDLVIPDGGPKVTIVGLPDTAVKESSERVRTALTNSGYFFPVGRLLVNLAPADVRKEGPVYDLPIAVGLLIASGVVPPAPREPTSFTRGVHPSALAAKHAEGKAGVGLPPVRPGAAAPEFEPLDVRRFIFAGELALDGRVRPIKGAIALASMAKSMKMQGVIVPADNATEAAVVDGIDVLGVRTLAELVGLLTGRLEAQPQPAPDVVQLLGTAKPAIDFADVRGQEGVKRAIVVAAAGAHNLLILGPAGTGKTMMAKALPGVLPPLSPEEAIEITRIYSAAGALAPGQGLVTTRPVRTPHHTASGAAIVGGGMIPRPGEVTLAHRGVLFLDELPEFPRDVLETLRQPMEDHVVTISRAHGSVRFPASFMLVAAMNPTPKGDVPADQVGRAAMERYLSKLSGPLLDRIDIHVEAPAVPWKELSRGMSGAPGPRGTSTAEMREKTLAARKRQDARQGVGVPNSRLSGKQLDALAPMSRDAQTLLGQAMTEMGLSARAYDKIRRLSRTIADLEARDNIEVNDVAEAVQYRLLDRKI